MSVAAGVGSGRGNQSARGSGGSPGEHVPILHDGNRIELVSRLTTTEDAPWTRCTSSMSSMILGVEALIGENLSIEVSIVDGEAPSLAAGLSTSHTGLLQRRLWA